MIVHRISLGEALLKIQGKETQAHERQEARRKKRALVAGQPLLRDNLCSVRNRKVFWLKKQETQLKGEIGHEKTVAKKTR